jgi:hypothetical protein
LSADPPSNGSVVDRRNEATTRTATRRLETSRIGRIAIAILFLAAIAEAAIILRPVIGQPITFGGDLDIYLAATRRLLDGGSFYPAEQLSGPYEVASGVVLYPPTTVPLFAAFIVLPRVLWWAIPLGITAYVVVQYRPSLFGWAIIAVCVAFPNSIALIVYGNPTMWATAAIALAMRQEWTSSFVFLKPSLAPFALIGIRDGRWWVVVVAAAIASIAFLPMWHDYLVVLMNLRGSGILYSLGDVPLALVPVVAWVAGGTTDLALDTAA